ncbi:group II intron maturase-specific domain-containing protein, partial [Streptomyces sp. EN16]
PFIRGWATYYRSISATRTFDYLDSYIWECSYRWALFSHQNKGKRWVASRYYRRIGNRKWVFADPGSPGYLLHFGDCKIKRHVMVKGDSSPDDPDLALYWEKRRRKRVQHARMTPSKVQLAYRQKGLCSICRTDLIEGAEYQPDNVREWVEWFEAMRYRLHADHLIYRRDGGEDHSSNLRLVHAECHRIHHANDGQHNLTGMQRSA